MTCNVKKHHRKRHPMSAGERSVTELAICLEKRGDRHGILRHCAVIAHRMAIRRKKRNAAQDAGVNPYKRKKAAG